MSRKKLNLPRVPLPRQRGGAHLKRRDLSAREELTLRLNEMEAEDREDAEDWIAAMREIFGEEEDYFDDLLSKLESAGGSRW